MAWSTQTSQRALQERTLARMSTKKNFFRNDVSTKAKNSATDLAIHSKERMYIVDNGASLHMMGYLPWITKKRRLSKILDIQTANGIVVSVAVTKQKGSTIY